MDRVRRLTSQLGPNNSQTGVQSVPTHCQVPCGIYDDDGRITQILEDAATIRKAVTKINELSGSHNAEDVNQLVRWITVKEQHASNIQKIVAEYFLTQKVKPVSKGQTLDDGTTYEDYHKIVEAHHRLLRAAMVVKQ